MGVGVLVFYYDRAEAEMRLKRRYVWGLWGFGIGVAAGMLLAMLF